MSLEVGTSPHMEIKKKLSKRNGEIDSIWNKYETLGWTEVQVVKRVASIIGGPEFDVFQMGIEPAIE